MCVKTSSAPSSRVLLKNDGNNGCFWRIVTSVERCSSVAFKNMLAKKPQNSKGDRQTFQACSCNILVNFRFAKSSLLCWLLEVKADQYVKYWKTHFLVNLWLKEWRTCCEFSRPLFYMYVQCDGCEDGLYFKYLAKIANQFWRWLSCNACKSWVVVIPSLKNCKMISYL